MTAHATVRPTRSNRSIGWVPYPLIAIVVVPAIAGTLRLVELAGGPHMLPVNPRITASPVPVIVRVLVGLGLAVAFSALWMTAFYPRIPGGELGHVFRLAFGTGMAASIILGFIAIRRRDVTSHRAWMARGYALALGAGTQAFTLGIGKAIFGDSDLTTALMLGAGWAINLAVVEYIIRARFPASVRARAPASVTAA